MSGFGSTLKFAREQKGLSVAQVSEMTRLSPTMVELLEQDNFSMIPAALYGRGFVKLFCQAVGLDPKPMIEQFMRLYDDGASAPRSALPSVRSIPPTPAPATPVAAEPPPAQSQLLIESSRTPAESAPTPVEIPASRYAAPQPIDERPSLSAAVFSRLHRIPSHIWRLAALSVCALIFATVIFFGVRALYRATSNAPCVSEITQEEQPEFSSAETASAVESEPNSAITAETEGTAAPTVSKPRRGTAIEPLYVD